MPNPMDPQYQTSEVDGMSDSEISMMEALPDDIRAQGWAVVCHNDYRLKGQSYTFWSFSRGREYIKGEGRTDAEALNQVRAQMSVSSDNVCGDCAHFNNATKCPMAQPPHPEGTVCNLWSVSGNKE